MTLTTPAAMQTSQTDIPNHAKNVTSILRVEGLAALALSVFGYHVTGASWWLFAALFLVPDLSILGYLTNTKVGALAYNMCHTYLAPAIIALAGAATHLPHLFEIALIWSAHIGFDRAIGYGLKYPHAFGATHLGWKGKVR